MKKCADPDDHPAQEPEEEKADGEQEELLAVWWEDRKYSGLWDE